MSNTINKYNILEFLQDFGMDSWVDDNNLQLYRKLKKALKADGKDYEVNDVDVVEKYFSNPLQHTDELYENKEMVLYRLIESWASSVLERLRKELLSCLSDSDTIPLTIYTDGSLTESELVFDGLTEYVDAIKASDIDGISNVIKDWSNSFALIVGHDFIEHKINSVKKLL